MNTTTQHSQEFEIQRRFDPFYSGGATAVSPDGRLIYCSFGNVINVLNWDTGSVICRHIVRQTIGSKEEEAAIVQFSLSCDGGTLAVAYENMLLKLWNLAADLKKCPNGKIVKIASRSCVHCMAYGRHPDLAHMLVIGYSDGSVKVWDTESRSCIGGMKCKLGRITSVALLQLSDQTAKVVFGTDTGGVCMWKYMGDDEKSNFTTLSFHSATVTTIIAMNNDQVLTASRDMTIVIWEARAHLLRRSCALYEPVECAILITNDLLIFGGESGAVRFVNLNSGCVVDTNKLLLRSRIQAFHHCRTSGPGTVCFAVTEDQNIYQLELNHDQNYCVQIRRQIAGNNGEVRCVAFLSNRLLLVATISNQLRMYDIESGDCHLIDGHSKTILTISTSSWSTELFVTGSEDGTARLWKLKPDTGQVQCLSVYSGHVKSVTAVQLCHENAAEFPFLITASLDRTVKIFSLKRKLLFSDGSTARQERRAVETASMTVVAHNKSVCCVALSMRKMLLATGSFDQTVKLWQVVPGDRCELQAIGQSELHGRGVSDVQFSPTDRLLASASGDCLLRLFSVDGSLVCLRTFQGHESPVLKLAIDGLRLISVDSHGLLKLWSLRSGLCEKTYDAHDGAAQALAVAPPTSAADGTSKPTVIATGGDDCSTLVWRDVTDERMEQAQQQRAKTLRHDQTLANLLESQRLSEALRLALHLRRPATVLRVLKEMNLGDQLHSCLAELQADHLQSLLQYSAEWNTNSRYCHYAQSILRFVLTRHTPEQILSWPTVGQFLLAWIPYTERHLQRIDRYKDQLPLIDFLLQSANVLPTLSPTDQCTSKLGKSDPLSATMHYYCLYTSALFLLAASSSAQYASQQAMSAGQSVLYYKPRPYFEPSENGYKIQPAPPAIGGYGQASKPSFPAAHLGGFPIPLQQQQIQHDQLVSQNIASDEFGRGPEKPLVFVPPQPIVPYSNSIVEEPSIPVVPGSYGGVPSPAYGLSTAVPLLAPYKNLKMQKATN
ncbi:WD domain, G-beta repeat-containing domain protein [Trichinella spiralis]|uniref:WD domain, G-beta repeat-containing domain protein n=1 Tax=Trichinella spiralis TaxID=6334 RepID=UPI0001EFC4C4|nr:WD domain, G-beta repeat-containing domain protein [Trichinella spiralis]